MRVKPKPRVDEVERIKGLTSRELTDRCPDQRTTFPGSPCTNVDCSWALESCVYMNCSFVAAEAVSMSLGKEHEGLSLEEIGEAMNLTREGVRLIQIKALRKLKAALTSTKEQHEPADDEPRMAAGPGR